MSFLKKRLEKSLFSNLDRFIILSSRFRKSSEASLLEKLHLPELDEKYLENFFFKIGNNEIKNYKEIINKFCDVKDLEAIPKNFSFSSGWTKYQNGECKQVNFPDEDALVFDVETLVSYQNRPVIAAALSSKAWYSWCSPAFFEADFNPLSSLNLNDLIPLESENSNLKERVVIGHNVSFDRSFIREQYHLKKSGLRFLDTMSMHIACSGFCEEQRDLITRNKNEILVNDYCETEFRRHKKPDYMWMFYGSKNNLKDVHMLYNPEEETLNKDARDIFIKGTLNDVDKNFQSLMSYCTQDVLATYKVFKKLTKIYSKMFEHPITFGGMLELGSMYLPIDRAWSTLKIKCELEQKDSKYVLQKLLRKSANEACEFLQQAHLSLDPWLNSLDWSLKECKIKLQSTKSRKFRLENDFELTDNSFYKILSQHERAKIEYVTFDPLTNLIFATKECLPKKPSHLINYPNWYRDLCSKKTEPNWSPGPSNMTIKQRTTPKLLRLLSNEKVVHYCDHHWCTMEPIEGSKFEKLDHSMTLTHKTITSPFSSELKTVRNLSIKISELQKLEKKISFQKAIWLKENGSENHGVILPTIACHASVSRMCTDYFWSSNIKLPYTKRKSLKEMIRCADGYIFVSVDLSPLQKLLSKIVANKSFRRTLILDSSITKCLEEDMSGQNFLAAKKGWFLESNFVDLQNLILVFMNSSIRKNKINARLVRSIDNEIVYLVTEQDRFLIESSLRKAILYSQNFSAFKTGLNELRQMKANIIIHK